MALKGAPRIVTTCAECGTFGVSEMTERIGLRICAGMLAWLQPWELGRSSYDTYAEKVAEGMASKMQPARRWWGHYMAEVAQAVNAEGVVFGNIYNCRPLSAGAVMIKKIIEEESGLPVLYVEWDPYDERFYGAEQLRTRMETFADLLMSKRVTPA